MALRVPVTWRDAAEHRRKLADGVNAAMDGQGFNAGSFTLTASTTATVVSDPRVGTETVVTWMPRTSNAAAAQSGMYVSARDKGEFTVTHASTGTSDRTFDYALHGSGRTS